MITAIVYSSQTGFTKAYAGLLAEKTGLPAYRLSERPEAQEVLYLGWLRAGKIVGLEEARKHYKTPCVCAVGMSPASESQTLRLRRENKVLGEDQLFYLQGGLDLARLKPPVRLVLKAICRSAAKKLSALSSRTPGEEATLQMTRGPYSAVSADNLADVLAWYEKTKG
jgi:hypothetical protein